jgi:hypothetical protein
MGMPAHLQRANRRPKRNEPRPLIDTLSFLDIRHLSRKKVFPPDYHGTNVLPDIGFICPGIASLKVTRAKLTANLYGGVQQVIPLRWYQPGFGGLNAIAQCRCGKWAYRLYRIHGALVCYRCTHGTYASQTLDRHTRPILQALRMRAFIYPVADLSKPFPRKPKTTMLHRTHKRLEGRCMAIERKIGRSRRRINKRISQQALKPRNSYSTRVRSHL